MLLAIDVGNTKFKAAVFEQDALKEKFIFYKNDAEIFFQKIFNQYPKIAFTILSSVGKMENSTLLWLENRSSVSVINHDYAFPFKNGYATPATLGVDRMVLTAGAVLGFPDSNRLVIDAGTCVTYDFCDAANNYHGGAISPGLQLRYNAMHNFTEKLPLLYPEMPAGYVGNSTIASMHSGAVNGLLYEIEGFIKRYEQEYQGLKIILTGGDAEFLAKRLKSTIFANSNFLLDSLNQLYLYTNKK